MSSNVDAKAIRSADACYAQMRHSNQKREIARAVKGRQRAPVPLRPLIDRALEERARTTARPPAEKLDVDVEAAMVALDLAHARHAVPYWIVKEGPSFALRALVRAHWFEPIEQGSGMVWIEESWHDDVRITYEGVWQLLSAVLATVDEEVYAEAREAALQLRNGPPLYVRSAIAFVFPAERAWADADANDILATQKRALHRESWLATVASHHLAERLLRMEGNWLDDAICMTLLATHGDEGAQLLLAALDNAPRVDVRKRYASAVALVSSKAAAEGLARWLGDKTVAPIATKYMLSNLELAREVLGEIARPGSKDKLAGAAALVLERLDSASDEKPSGKPARGRPPSPSRAHGNASVPALKLTPLPYQTRIGWKKGESAKNKVANAQWDKDRVGSSWKKTHATDEKLVAWMGDRSLPLFWIGRIRPPAGAHQRGK